MKRACFIFLIFITCSKNFAQPGQIIFRDALKENRQKLYHNIVNNTITKNLSLPLTDSTEDLWQDAFWAMELINYRSAWVDSRIHTAFEDIQKRNTGYQRSLLEMVYTLYPNHFLVPVKALLMETPSAKVFVLCAVYIMQSNDGPFSISFLAQETKQRLGAEPENPILQQLQFQISEYPINNNTASIQSLLQKDFLPGHILMFSFQRKNRNYPGIVIIRDSTGNFIKEDDGRIFSVQQLARSVSNLPGYLTNGNTPEGIFRMDGFDISKSSFIGPTENIQLTMPFEYKASHFYIDSTLVDTLWNIDSYRNLLPENFKNYYPIYQSFYAGKAGRSEIIAHGTTIDPSYYKNQSFFPFTPTMGCLCTKELWNEESGMLLLSDQQRLVNAITKAGGPQGYAIVINLDDQQKPVSIDEIIKFLKP